MSRNDKVRKAAIEGGQDTYQHEVIEYWAACCVCCKPIKRNALNTGRPGVWRICACPGVLWNYSYASNGWTKRSADEASTL